MGSVTEEEGDLVEGGGKTYSQGILSSSPLIKPGPVVAVTVLLVTGTGVTGLLVTWMGFTGLLVFAWERATGGLLDMIR